MDQLLAVGIREFVFVIGYLSDKIKQFVETSYPEIEARYVVQYTREGLGHAIWLTREAVDPEEEVVIALGDTIIEADIGEFTGQPYSALAYRKVDDPRNFGVAEIDREGFITKVSEKPRIPKSNLALVGWYKIREFGLLIDSLDDNISRGYKTHGEFQLTDAIMMMIRKGARITGFKVENWYDCGQKDVLLEINAMLLRKQAPAPDKHRDQLRDSIVIPPVHIGEGAVVRQSIIGPNLTIGDHAVIEHSILRESIIGSYTNIRKSLMTHSIVGSDSVVVGPVQQLNIGDNTELDLSPTKE